MLRTFHSNPSLGGFGSEEQETAAAATPDAFCQIVKELVDNAVDACMVLEDSECNNTATNTNKNKRKKQQTRVDTRKREKSKRVRVVIQKFSDNSSFQKAETRNIQDDDHVENHSTNHENDEILRVTVSDNGCGMSDIQACVGAFHTSKAHNATQPQQQELPSTTTTTSTTNNTHTAGRYGIGLTLVLLHAQRLVPNSCASIQSATCADSVWKVVAAAVDTESDAIRCLPRESIPKNSPSESGTSISILVPGGIMAEMAWPRLAEYFARFKLSLGRTFSLEVMAPTLSRVPLFIRMPTPSKTQGQQTNKTNNTARNTSIHKVDGTTENDWIDGKTCFESEVETATIDDDDDDDTDGQHHPIIESDEYESPSQQHIDLWKAAQLFLGRPVDLCNVAHTVIPIRRRNAKHLVQRQKDNASGPTLEVAVVVHGPSDDEEGEEPAAITEDDLGDAEQADDHGYYNGHVDATDRSINNTDCHSTVSATMVVVRMVNNIPLLDGAEAVACGFVQGLASKKRMWNSFGLDVSLQHDREDIAKVPTYAVQDSEQVAPFFKTGAHNLLERDDNDSGYESENSNITSKPTGIKRSLALKRHNILPASIRLGNILVVVQIHAEPASLPLPTLSKGRLPINNRGIDDAMEVGMTRCLQQLQKTNPMLLLTASELRNAERDARYVPAVALALSSIITKAVTIKNSGIIELIQGWSNLSFTPNSVALSNQTNDKDLPPEKEHETTSVEDISNCIKGRIRLVLSRLSESQASSKKRKRSEKYVKEDEDNSNSDHDDDLPSIVSATRFIDEQVDQFAETSKSDTDVRESSGDEYDEWL